MQPPCVLTVAGSDSGGGAGIQADLKSIMMQGCYGLSVITALTAQNTRGVTAIEAPTPGFVAEQLRAVLSDFPIRAAKTGMLFSAPIIEAVVGELAGKTFPLVVDPVCVAQSGANLLQSEAVSALKARLFPLAALVTPNRHEAELLAGMAIDSPATAREAMERLLSLGAGAVLLKGGHFEARDADGRAVRTDWLLTAGGELHEYVRPHVDTVHTHGTGCTLSAAIAAHLALGEPLPRAVESARDYLQLALRCSYPLGNGEGPVHHLMPFVRQADRLDVLDRLAQAGSALGAVPGLAAIVPPGGARMALAVALAASDADVASLDILATGSGARFGLGGEASRLLLALTGVGMRYRCLLPLRHDPEVLQPLEALGTTTVSLAAVDGGAAAFAPDVRGVLTGLGDAETVCVLCGQGGGARKPQAFLLGRDTASVLNKVRALAIMFS